MYHSNGAPHPSSFFRGWGGCWESETWYYSSEHSVTLCFYPWPEIIQDFAGVNSHHCNPRLEQNSSTCITQVPLAPDHVSPLLGVSLLLTVELEGSLHYKKKKKNSYWLALCLKKGGKAPFSKFATLASYFTVVPISDSPYPGREHTFSRIIAYCGYFLRKITAVCGTGCVCMCNLYVFFQIICSFIFSCAIWYLNDFYDIEVLVNQI